MNKLLCASVCFLSLSVSAATDEEVDFFRSAFWNPTKTVTCNTPGYAVAGMFIQETKLISIFAFAYRDPPSYDATRYYDVYIKKTAEHRRYVEHGELDFCVSLACFRSKSSLEPLSEENFYSKLRQQYPNVIPMFQARKAGGC